MPLPTLKLLIFGSRKLASHTIVPRSIGLWITERRRLGLMSWPTLVIHGDALGIDKVADWWALGQEIPRDKYPPNYQRYPGHRAPLIRNDVMVSLCDCGLAIWDGSSTGTKYTIDAMRRERKHLVVVVATPSAHGPVLAVQEGP